MDNAYSQRPYTGPVSADRTLTLVNAFMRRVYNWMAGGLALSAVVAFWVMSSPAVCADVHKLPDRQPHHALLGGYARGAGPGLRPERGHHQGQGGNRGRAFHPVFSLERSHHRSGASGLHRRLGVQDLFDRRRHLRHHQHLGLHHQKRPVRLGFVFVHGPHRHHSSPPW